MMVEIISEQKKERLFWSFWNLAIYISFVVIQVWDNKMAVRDCCTFHMSCWVWTRASVNETNDSQVRTSMQSPSSSAVIT